MSVVVSPSEASSDASRLARLRATGGVSLAFGVSGGDTRLVDLEERGGYRAKFPRGEIGAEAVFINTGGGMLGGDRYRFDVAIGDGAAATVASQSAERVYRALDAPTETVVTLRVGKGGSLAWLPQETILFDGARLSRRIDVDLAPTATLLMAEAVVFGRGAMGERVRDGSLRDRWSVHRDGVIVFAEAASLSNDVDQQMDRAAVGGGARVMATLVYVAPDAEERRDGVRDALGTLRGRAAISAWNGLLTTRFLAPDLASLRGDLVRVATCLARRPMPRVWNC